MSILIEGMEMPRTCYDCKFRKRNGLELICPVLERSYKIADTQVLFFREKDCPLIEVPEPHGRLGDLDKLEQMFVDIDNAPYSGFDGEEPFYSAEDAAQIIRLAPTVIPASEEG